MCVRSRARNVSGVSERFQLGDQVDPAGLRIFCQASQLFGGKRILVVHKATNRSEVQGTSLIVSQSEMQCVEFPIRTEINYPPIVFQRLWNAASVHHETAHFPTNRGPRRR